MNIFKKVSLILISIIILFFLISNGIFGFNVNTDKGKIEQNVFNPFNVIIQTEGDTLKVNSQSDFTTILTSPYKKFNNYPNDNNFKPSDIRYCIVGGNYSLQVLSYPKNSALFNKTINLFYCRTTQDLINQIEIPEVWVNNNLILYCNDGSEINSKINNFDFLTTKLQTYKACILKNLDRGKTILFGYEVGNPILDSDNSFFFNTTTNQSKIINSDFKFVNKNNGVYTFNDKTDDKNYYFKYDDTTKFYSLSDTNESFNLTLNTSIFTNDIKISRVALFRHFSSGKNIYGYEKITSTNGVGPIVPIYKIDYNGAITLSNDQCANSLKKYGAISEILGKTDKILCTGGKSIEIYSNKIDGDAYGKNKVDDGKVTSFNIFKNIILGLNG